MIKQSIRYSDGLNFIRDAVLPRSFWDHRHWRLPRRPLVRILVVIDGRVSADPRAAFGVGKMIEILQKNAPHADPDFGYVRFEVDVASRDATPMLEAATYTNFRFDQQVDGQPLLNQYHQVWCFGDHPGDSGSPEDAPIEAHGTRLSADELRVLTRWMNERNGGVLAMGDHHFLGATLAWKIPRVRSMRRWTNADGVPPVDGPITSAGGATRYRHDTSQPQNALQADPDSTEPISPSAQIDAIPQPIEVRYFGGFLRARPHPILCGGNLGVIDILPDHPHEGWVYDDAEVPVDNAYDFGGGVAGLDFPNAADGGSRPVPRVIAWGNPWPEPPYDHFKQPTGVTRFPLIGTYDGHRANVGRVVVDSTWHHWFNMNIDRIEAAASGGTAEQILNWKKIKTYFRNVAVWLCPPSKQRSMLTYAAFWSLGSPLAIEEYNGGKLSWELGETAKDILGQYVSKCTLYDWLWPRIPALVLERFRVPIPEGCLTCPPIELLENAVLGGLIRAMLPERERLFAERLAGKLPSVNLEHVALAVEKGSAAGLKEFQVHWRKSLDRTQKVLQELERPPVGNGDAKLEDVLQDLALEDADFDSGRD